MNTSRTAAVRERDQKTILTDDMRRQKKTSALLSDILDTHGLNTFVSDIKRKHIRLEEFTQTFLTGTRNMASDGCAEGTEVKGSDSDVMGIIQCVSVVEPHEHDVSDVPIELVMVKDGCDPGYVKLEVRKYDFASGFSSEESIFLFFFRIIISKCGSKQYFSSEKFQKNIKVYGYTMPDNFTDLGITVCGPAHKNKTLLGEVDYVRAFECRSWPKPARDWLTRPRTYQWPSAELLKKLPDKCQCYVVPTGDESSTDADIQWRVSFVSIERELVWHMNDTQLKCFIILKILLKSIEQNLPENTLKTYHLKNVMFWLLEEIPAEKWNKNTLMSRVHDSLQKLIHYVRERALPQYLLPENNLFKNRLLSVHDIRNTISCLQNVSENVLPRVRAGLQYRNLPFEVAMDKKSWYNGFQVRANNDLGNFIIYISSGVSSSRIREYSDVFIHQFPDEAKQFLPSINLAIARAMFIEQLHSNRDEKVSRRKIDKYLHKASVVDSLRSCLYRALFDFNGGKYREIRKQIEGNVMGVIKQRNQNMQDIYLTYIDNNYVPNVIILEQVLKGEKCPMRINQYVLSYLLIFLSEHILGHTKGCVNAIDILSQAIDCAKRHKYYFVYLNFLGYCYALLGHKDSAFKTFCKSLQTFPSVTNAAVYHMAFMVNGTVLVCCNK
ncbi:uncharacterized protein LOC128549638 [Mercenaria mercenaria]|uniref:uncharacterized protein LOC128549638 n=1 Tax=Mercenaria mercenaria TaxID=6596 RepID=UPI00234EC754|nr:uncharacterized protein LOC128549638 [Mercenaria mercenaria]